MPRPTRHFDEAGGGAGFVVQDGLQVHVQEVAGHSRALGKLAALKRVLDAEA